MVSVMVTRIGGRRKPHLYIEEWMEVRGLSFEDVANRLDTSRQTVYRWAKEQHRLDPNKQAALAHVLDLEPEELWRPPSRPSLDAKLRNASDDDVKEAAELLEIFVRRQSKRA